MTLDKMRHAVRTSRRSVLKSGLAAAGLAGVGASGVGRVAATATSGTTRSEQPVVGHGGDGLTTLNPFEAELFPGRLAGPALVLDAVYDRGVRFHPETNEPVPVVLEPVAVHPENAGTDEPAVVARVRDGFSWHDGEPVTANDVAFTVEYVLDEEAGSGFLDAERFARVSDVRVSGDRVEYVLDEPEPAWLERVLGQPILPEHVWSDVDDPTARAPHEDGGPVGSGAFEVTAVEFPPDPTARSVTLAARDGYAVPDVPGRGPFVDGLRFEFYGSQAAVADAVLAGDVDVAAPQVSVADAVVARDADGVSVAANPNQFVTIAGYNLRRVPFDDRTFRQFLTRAWDDRFHVEESFAGFAVDGDYAVPPPRRNFRPAEPEAPEAEQFPFFDDGAGGLDVEAARDFLRDADAAHEYTFGPVESDLVTGDAELRVDGERLPTAHTDNDGTEGQGPLVFLTSGDEDGPNDASWDRWVDVLQTVGVPVRRESVPFPEEVSRVFRREAFDVFEIGINTGSPQLAIVTLGELFGAESADLDGSADGIRFNATAYTGTEDPLDGMETMDTVAREEAGREVLQTVYEDCPVNVVDYDPHLEPVSREWTGLVDAVGGVANYFTWLSIRPSVVAVAVNVKPDSERNTVNPTSRGPIPVAILQTADFDPSRVDVASLRFGPPDVVENGGGATPAHDGHREDVDGDGDADLVVHFPARDAGFEDGDESAVLVGETTDGQTIRGTDAVAVVAAGRGPPPGR